MKERDLASLATAALMVDGPEPNAQALSAMARLPAWVPAPKEGAEPVGGPRKVLAQRMGGWKGQPSEVPRQFAVGRLCALCLYSRSDIVEIEEQQQPVLLGTLGNTAVALIPGLDGTLSETSRIVALPARKARRPIQNE